MSKAKKSKKSAKTAKKTVKKTAKKLTTHRCGVCKKSGHNARTCAK